MPQVGIEGWNRERRAAIAAEIGRLWKIFGALIGASIVPLMFGSALATDRRVGGYVLCAIGGILIASAVAVVAKIVALKKSAKRDMTW